MKGKIQALSALSAVLYGLWGSIAAVSLRSGMSAASTGLFIFALSSVFSCASSGGHVSVPRIKWVAAGIMFAAANYILFSIMSSSYLSSAYVFVPSSVIIFFIISGWKSRPGNEEVLKFSIAIAIIVAGMAVSQITGTETINLADLALGLIVALLYGVSSYLTAYTAKPGTEMAQIFWITLSEIVVFLPLFAITGIRVTYQGIMLSAIAAISISAGLYLELYSYNALAETKFALMNMVNILTNLDSLFVALASIILGSFTGFSIFGLILVFIGASLLIKS
ncbi:MAG: hypothetical protein ACP5NC_05260 [Nitrososphaeria archaeon]